MKKFLILFIATLFSPNVFAQDINDALRYNNGDIIGTARYRALSGAFGALGGDLSAISINPAGSSVFNNSTIGLTLGSLNVDNDINYFNGTSSSSDSNISLQQAGGVFVFESNNQNSKWRKFALGIAYDNYKNYENNWSSRGVNSTSIDHYFLNNAQGLHIDDITAFPGETYTDAYSEIGNLYGAQNQQAFLGYNTSIIDLENNTVDSYTSNIVGNNFDQQHYYNATGYNGKVAFNASAEFDDNLYLGLNLNSHFINYERLTSFREYNDTTGEVINDVLFENTLIANGSGFSFQLGAIYKLENNLRLGLIYDSPTWYSIDEETTQYIQTRSNDGITYVDDNGPYTFTSETINPQIVNIYPTYRLRTPAKLTGSIAYVFEDKGLLSFDYSRKNYGNTQFRPTNDTYFASQNLIMENVLTTASTYKIGGEYRIKKFSLRAGYRLEESPYENVKTIGDLTGYSAGIGYKFRNTNIDLTYDRAEQSYDYQLFNTGLTDAATLDAVNSNISLSVSFQL